MLDEPGPWALTLGGHHERGERQLGAHMIAHRPADDLARGEVEDRGEVEPSLSGGDVGDVRQPDGVRRRCRERLLQQVRRDRKVVAAVRRAGLEPTSCQAANAVLWRIRRATRPRLTVRPSARSAACILGEP